MPETFTDMSNIDKYRVEQTIRLLYFKHRGDIAKIADESGYDPKLIERIGAKIKRRMRRDADELIAGNITQHILAGAQERTAYLRDAINKFFDNKPQIVSSCCQAPYNTQTFDGDVYYTCAACGKECTPKVIDNTNPKAFCKIIELMQEEDKLLIEFADKMGFTAKDHSSAPTQNVTNFNFVAANTAKPLSKEDQTIIQDIRQMDPRSRERLRKEIEAKIINDGQDK